MDRTPEPELMNELAQAQAYADADFSASDQAVIDRFGELFPEGAGRRVVDLGCGPGNISFRLLQRYPEVQVLGIDGSAVMLQLAEQQRQRASASLAGRLQLACVCLPAAQLPGGYGAVVSNSLLHHLHDPQVLWQAIRQLGASGARIYIKDLRRPPTAEAAQALLQRYLQAAPPILQRDYLASLHAAFTPDEVEQQLAQADLLGPLQVAPRDDRYLEVWGRLD